MKLTPNDIKIMILQEAKKDSKKSKKSKNLKDILDHDDVADVVHALHDGWAGEGGDGNLVSKADWMKIGKIKESALRSIISNEIRKLSESCAAEQETGHGCPSCEKNQPCGCEDLADEYDHDEPPMSHDEGLDSEYNAEGDHEGVSCEDAHPGMSHDEHAETAPLEDAWSGGENLVADSFSGCEDPTIIAPYMNHRAGVEMLGVPCPDSYRSVGDSLVSKPSAAIKMIQALMDSTGATCPSSAAQALADIIHFAKMDRFNG